VSPSGITLGDYIQGADAVDDTCQLSLQDRDEAGDRAENKGRRRCLRHHLGELAFIGNYVEHVGLSPLTCAWMIAGTSSAIGARR